MPKVTEFQVHSTTNCDTVPAQRYHGVTTLDIVGVKYHKSEIYNNSVQGGHSVSCFDPDESFYVVRTDEKLFQMTYFVTLRQVKYAVRFLQGVRPDCSGPQ